jgi:hypothetical protein
MDDGCGNFSDFTTEFMSFIDKTLPKTKIIPCNKKDSVGTDIPDSATVHISMEQVGNEERYCLQV